MKVEETAPISKGLASPRLETVAGWMGGWDVI